MERTLAIRTAVGLGVAVSGAIVLTGATSLPSWLGLVPLGGIAALVGPRRGRGLGLGSWVIAAAVAEGAAVAALVAILAGIVDRALDPDIDETLGERVASRVVLGAVGAVAGLLASRGLVAAAIGALALQVAAERWGGRWTPALALDGAGWISGLLVVRWGARLGPSDLALLTLCLTLLCGEIARQSLLHRRSGDRVGSLERLHDAHVRILGETSGFGGIAAQIGVECRNVLPVHWMELRRTQTGEIWNLGPDGSLRTGPARPSAFPPALPGIHRRAEWRVLVHDLDAEDRDLARLRLWCDPRRIEPEAEDLLASLVPQMASAVHRAELDREARLDPLTEVPVRRILDRRLQKAFAAACDEGRTFAVVMCDVDHFKRVNDTRGHAAGDEVLRGVARALEGERREGDLLCRYGGEEFTLLLEDTDGDAALHLADRLRRAVGRLSWDLEDGPLRVTLSAGVAAFPEVFVKTGSELLLLADEALYRAKEDGRDRCRLLVARETFRGPGEESPEPVAAPRLPRIFT